MTDGVSYCGWNYGASATYTDIRVHGPKIFSNHNGGEYVSYRIDVLKQSGTMYDQYVSSGWSSWKWATPTTPADFTGYTWTTWDPVYHARSTAFWVQYQVKDSAGNIRTYYSRVLNRRTGAWTTGTCNPIP